MTVRLLHFADVHLDSRFEWAGHELAERHRQALRDTLHAILRLAVAEKVDAVLCAGDLFEDGRTTPDTMRLLQAEFADVAPLPVLLAPGNHDWLGPQSPYRLAEWSSNVHLFAEDRLAPWTLIEGFTVWGAAHLVPANTDGFLDGFHVDRGGVNIALFHGSERLALFDQAEGKQPHAPFDRRQIASAGLDHAFVGHYHTPEDNPAFTYPGNPDPLSFGEDGPRGAVVATVADDGRVMVERHVVSHIHLHDVVVDVSGCTSGQEVRDRVRQGVLAKEGAVRLTLTGDLEPDVTLDLAQLQSLSSSAKLVVRASGLRAAYDFEKIASERTVRGQFVRDVLTAPDLDETIRRRVLTTGLRALSGRCDLAVP